MVEMDINKVIHKFLQRKLINTQVHTAIKFLTTSTSSNCSFSQYRRDEHASFNLSRAGLARVGVQITPPLMPSAALVPKTAAEKMGPSAGNVILIAKGGGGRIRSGLKEHRIVPGGKCGLMRDGIG
jgi:hypothetical protein